MCLAPANPIKQYKQGGIHAAMTPPGLPTIPEIRKNPSKALKPTSRVMLNRLKDVN